METAGLETGPFSWCQEAKTKVDDPGIDRGGRTQGTRFSRSSSSIGVVRLGLWARGAALVEGHVESGASGALLPAEE